MEKDYSKYEGKHVFVVIEDDIYSGVVAGCDKDIGVTIIDNSDINRYLLCISGPMSPHIEHMYQLPGAMDYYNEMFEITIGEIEVGVVNWDSPQIKALNDKYNFRNGYDASADTCPFNQ